MQIGLYEAVSGMKAQAAYQDTLSENLGRMTAPGHKRIITAFELPPESALQKAGAAELAGTTQNLGMKAVPLQARTVIDFSPGLTHSTGTGTDFAIEGGNTLFKIREKDGSFSYTRDVQFRLDRNGKLVTSDGSEVMMQNDVPLNLNPADRGKLTIEKDGTVRGGGVNQTKRGSLALVHTDEPRNLFVQGPGGRFRLADDKDKDKLKPGLDADSTLKQGYLEDSNTDSVSQMVNLVQVVRAYEANQKSVLTQDDANNKMISAADPSTS
jgi:flagellar basal body rod protein FlgG